MANSCRCVTGIPHPGGYRVKSARGSPACEGAVDTTPWRRANGWARISVRGCHVLTLQQPPCPRSPKAHVQRLGELSSKIDPVNTQATATLPVEGQTDDLPYSRSSRTTPRQPRRRMPPALTSEPLLEGCAETKKPFLTWSHPRGYTCPKRGLLVSGGQPSGASVPSKDA